MHLADFNKGIIGSNAVVGAHLPISLGAGLAAQYKKTDKVSVAFTGDGSTNIGAFHESMNLAAVWRLPVVVVVENNHYGEYSPSRPQPQSPACPGEVAYGIPGLLVDGNDLLTVRQVADRAISRAPRGPRPDADRGGHLPARGPLPLRSGEIPARRRARACRFTRDPIHASNRSC